MVLGRLLLCKRRGFCFASEVQERERERERVGWARHVGEATSSPVQRYRYVSHCAAESCWGQRVCGRVIGLGVWAAEPFGPTACGTGSRTWTRAGEDAAPFRLPRCARRPASRVLLLLRADVCAVAVEAPCSSPRPRRRAAWPELSLRRRLPTHSLHRPRLWRLSSSPQLPTH